MPALDADAVRQFWQERHDHALYRIIMSMEAVEHWPLDDDPEFEVAIKKLGDYLEDCSWFELAQEDNLIKTLISLRASRALRLLQHIDTLKPGSASKLLVYAEVASNSSEDLPGFFLKRNLVFERLQLLGRIFAPERFALVGRVLDSD